MSEKKKNLFYILIACIMCLLLALTGCNNNTPGGGDEAQLPDSTASLTFEKDGNSYTVTGVGEETVVVIPAEHEGLPVTKIQGHHGTGAFAQKAFTSVTIPDTVTEIGQNTFYGCRQLASVYVGANSVLTTIGNNAFSACSSLKNVTIPKGVTTIGDAAFNNCASLERFSVASGNTVYRSENGHLIERATNTLIRGVNNTIVPDSVKIIGQAAFRRANGITELNIPESVEKIGNYFIADSTITKINYAGTEAEWNAIEKSATMWNYGKENVQITFAQNAPVIPEPPVEDEKEITVMYLYINNNKLEVTLAKNKAVTALIDILKQGDIIYTANDYGGFEKVGSLGHSLPTENSQITTEAGDVILYSGNQIVLFYGSNSWSYTRLGKINGYSVSELRTLLDAGNGNIQVRISLN